MAVAGIAAIGAVGAVATTSSNSSNLSGYDAAQEARHLEVEAIGSDPDKVGTDALSQTPSYLAVPDFQKCLVEESVPGGTSTQWCVPGFKPSACIDESWGEITKQNMNVPPCKKDNAAMSASSIKDLDLANSHNAVLVTPAATTKDASKVPSKAATKAATKGAPATEDYTGSTEMGSYKLKLRDFFNAHKPEITKFMDDHKEAIDDAKEEISNSIKTGKFDFEHYKQQIEEIVDQHDIEAYKTGIQKYTTEHKPEIAQFIEQNKGVFSDVSDRIATAIKEGKFDYEHYQEQLQSFVSDFDLGKYRQGLDAWMVTHQDEVQQFVAANKQAVVDVQQDIDDLVDTGGFDYEHYQQQIQQLVTAYDKGYSKYSSNVDMSDAESQFADAIEQAKSSEAGKTLTGRLQGAASNYAGSDYDFEENMPVV